MVRCASEAIGFANTIRELGQEAQVRIWKMLQRHADWLSEAGAAQSNTWRRRIFGCSLHTLCMRGGIWKGDIMVADIEELEEMDACELHARRLNAKEVLTPQEVETSYSQSQMEQSKSFG